ncbi:CBS domain-containing protein [Streptomyces sp. ICBB 8177]|uniref:CBS domain-containing protein n=1 Tax=Streptomyces sp. ICBB 8177 TaxID=563922 RepID=UPI000D68304A|nr:CBS domain-containing protein [Streptomyces sp. ICBB 8177]PWI44734.1 histidine kinase [Streptomyces sp. ICBB 8177]
MKIADLMTAPPVTAASGTSVRVAANRMDEDDVGSVLVGDEGLLRGVLTDRDLAIRVVAPGLSPEIPAGEAMSSPSATVDVTDSVEAAFRALRTQGARRLPDGHRLAGLVTLVDLLLDVLQRFVDLLRPVSWSMLSEPAGRGGERGAARA